MKKVLAVVTAVVLSAVLLAGCGAAEKTPEEVEQERLEAIAAEEASTGLKRFDSPNLEDYELPLRTFAEGIQENDPEKICTAVGSPTVLMEDEVYGWVLENGYDVLYQTPLEELKVKSVRENATATLTFYGPDEDTAANDSGHTMQAVYENGTWVLVPDAGVVAGYSFTAPTNNISCGTVDLKEYAVSTDADGVWTFQVPHMVVSDTMSNFKITTQLGTFDAFMYSAALGYVTTPQLIADMSDQQISEYSQVAATAFSTVFDYLKNGADQNQVSTVLVSESLIKGCFPQTEEAKAELMSKWGTVTGVTVTPADPTNGYPKEYVYRLYKDNSVILNSKLLISTTIGECRKLATITLQLVNNEWKIANVVCSDNTNPFSDFSVYNPAW